MIGIKKKKNKKKRWDLEGEVDAGRVSPVVPQRFSIVRMCIMT